VELAYRGELASHHPHFHPASRPLALILISRLRSRYFPTVSLLEFIWAHGTVHPNLITPTKSMRILSEWNAECKDAFFTLNCTGIPRKMTKLLMTGLRTMVSSLNMSHLGVLKIPWCKQLRPLGILWEPVQ